MDVFIRVRNAVHRVKNAIVRDNNVITPCYDRRITARMNTVHFKPPRPPNMFNFSWRSWRFEVDRVHSRRYPPDVTRCYHGRWRSLHGERRGVANANEHGPFQTATKNLTWLIFPAVPRGRHGSLRMSDG